MTLEELKNRCINQGFKYAYGIFKNPTEPPHLVSICRDSNNFVADNKVFKKKTEIQLDYTYVDKDVEIQNKIEDNILYDVVWEKTEETYIADENIWQVSYFFEI